MLDAFRSMTSGKNKQVQQQTDELQLLITSAREERSALSTMLTTLTARSAKLTPFGKSLEQVIGAGDRPPRRSSTSSRKGSRPSTIARRRSSRSTSAFRR